LSRVSDFGDVHAGARDRLLLQLYAYCGDAAAADDALNEAFIGAAQRWRRVSAQGHPESWLRDQAIKRLDGRPGPRTTPGGTQRSSPNGHLLAALQTLDPTSRRLLIARRLGDVELSRAAREVGLTPAEAEQALARASSTLHGHGVDTTPAGLRRGLGALGADLTGLEPTPAPALLRSGARRRVAVAVVAVVAVLVAAVLVGTVLTARSGNSPAGPTLATGPSTSPAGPTSNAAPELDESSLLTAAALVRAGWPPAGRWRQLPPITTPPSESVYGGDGCVQAADNPPPGSSWSRDFASGGAAGARLRQVLQLAPSQIEATRAYHQVVDGFTGCVGHQLLAFSRVRGLGARAHLIRLHQPRTAGALTEVILVTRTGAAVSVLVLTSRATDAAAVTSPQLVRAGGSTVNGICADVEGPCGAAPYRLVRADPPPDPSAPGFLSVVDLPAIPGIVRPWFGTAPRQVEGDPSVTPCDRTSFAAGGATSVTTRSFVIPRDRRLPTAFGITETRALFSNEQDAKAVVSEVARAVAGCHRRQSNLSVPQTSSFSGARADGRIWRIYQQVSKRRELVFRTALIRVGPTVAAVTFTPVDRRDVSRTTFAALARRATVRLDG